MTKMTKIEELKEKLTKAQELHKISKAQAMKDLDVVFNIQNELYKERIIAGDYITDLSPYEGKRITFIYAFDSNGKKVSISTDEICEVENGKLFSSSYYRGIIKWDESKQKYIHLYFGAVVELDIVGFLIFETEDE